MDRKQFAHVADVLRIGDGVYNASESHRDAIIRDSWRRCIELHRLDPTTMQEPYILPHERLREHQDSIDEFLRIARHGVETLYRQVAGMGYVVLLTDARGITVDFIGDPTFDNQLRKAGLYLGADWNESHAGTCGVGTCINTGQALTVHQDDHFDATHIPLTCTAAPVFDPLGDPLAVLDISALKSPQPKSSQHLARQLVQIYAHKIENATFLHRFRRDWIIKLNASPEFMDLDPEYLVALDGGGRILGFNHLARRLLQRESSGDPEAVPLLGEPFGQFFECDLAGLSRYVHSRPSEKRAITLGASRKTLFAEAMPPQVLHSPRREHAAASSAEPPVPAPMLALTGGDPTMDRHLARAARLVNANISILLLGETGTGKERFAKAMHDAGARSRKPFIGVNCAAIPESLIESELFGYASGAFTGARSRGKKGMILEADGGTLFLDEIGDMALGLQGRLLRVLAERELWPIGASGPVPVDVRVMSATHRDLVEMVVVGEFRDDLYYRLNGAVFQMPPLRERADLDWLIERLLAAVAERDGRPAVFGVDALDRLRGYQWPGNIRELRNVVEYACAVSRSRLIRELDLPEYLAGNPLIASRPGPKHHAATDNPARPVEEKGRTLKEALRRHKWNVSAAARSLGISRATIYRHMKQYGIVPPNLE